MTIYQRAEQDLNSKLANIPGYASTFQWRGKFIDRTRSDSWGRKCVEVVAMDALRFPVSIKQYSWKNVLRELNKAYCAFCRLEPGHIVGDGEESNCANSPGLSYTFFWQFADLDEGTVVCLKNLQNGGFCKECVCVLASL